MSDEWEVKIVPSQRWGPFAYYLTAAKGFRGVEGRFAWTSRQADRKARRWIAQLTAADDRKKAETRIVRGRSA